MWEHAALRIGAMRWRRKAVVVMEFDAIRRAYGKSIQGLLGLDVLTEFGGVEFNFAQRTLHFRQPSDTSESQR